MLVGLLVLGLLSMLAALVILFMAGAKMNELSIAANELHGALIDVVNKVEAEVNFTDQSPALTRSLDDARKLCVERDPYINYTP